ncbi:SdiA-regulated domain-containing protein [Roseovarius aestuariivivens]|uniref:SdiA-regulated domain-containing protein n=1 Tax=Roseovarius aestuariivivens TaxID=1888910 RepID=UPI001436959A|nr:SdiA-regulated domain-containing protein [Roseovarius aestuariivivens]
MWRSARVFAALVLAGAATADPAEDGLRYVGHVPLFYPAIGLNEPSGLAVDPDGKGFWVVSDDTEAVFWLGVDGDLRPYFEGDPRLRDLEGIALDPANARLLVVSERRASVIALPLQIPEPMHEVALDAIAPDGHDALWQDRDNGLEGITVDPVSGAVLAVKENDPRLLIEMSPGLDTVTALRDLEAPLADLGGEDEDVSGLAADPARGGLWLLSDTGRAVSFLAAAGGESRRYALFWQEDGARRSLRNPEGVAVSADGRFLFVVTDDDRDSKLVQYEIPDAP